MTVMDKLVSGIIQKLEEGVVPWNRPWAGGGSAGKNIISNKPYHGINWLLTMLSGYDSQYWMTFKQARQLGGNVKKGEKGLPIVYFRMLSKKDNPDEKVPLMRYYIVFNIRQCEIPAEYLPAHAVAEITQAGSGYTLSEDEKIQQCDEVYELWEGHPELTQLEQSAYYRPSTDTINMPAFESFITPQHYYSTLYHEMTHSTGAVHRLNRPEVAGGIHTFGSKKYGYEELVAEMGAARLCHEVGIDNVVDESAAYIDHWLKAIKETPSMLYKAAAAADKAATHILGDLIEEEQIEADA